MKNIKQITTCAVLFLTAFTAVSCTCSQSAGNHPPGSTVVLQGPDNRQIARTVDSNGNINVPCDENWTVTS